MPKKNYYPEAQKRYKKKYLAEKVDTITFRVPKGKRDEFKEYAELQGKSLARFMLDCIDEKIQKIKSEQES